MGSRSGARLGIVITLVAAAALMSAAQSGARVVAETNVTISKFLPLYHGKVKSAFRECEKGRKVFLFRKRPGPDQKVGKDRANNRGKWKIGAPGNLAPGDRFYAKARNFEASGTGTGLSCLRDKSRTVTFVGD